MWRRQLIPSSSSSSISDYTTATTLSLLSLSSLCCRCRRRFRTDATAAAAALFIDPFLLKTSTAICCRLSVCYAPELKSETRRGRRRKRDFFLSLSLAVATQSNHGRLPIVHPRRRPPTNQTLVLFPSTFDSVVRDPNIGGALSAFCVCFPRTQPARALWRVRDEIKKTSTWGKEEEKKEKKKKRRRKFLTVDDEFATSFHAGGWSLAAVAGGQKRIDGRADQFGVVIFGRRNEFQGAGRVAAVHRHLAQSQWRERELG